MSKLSRAILHVLVESARPLTLLELTAAVEARGFAIKSPSPARTVRVALCRLDMEGLVQGDDCSPQRLSWTRRQLWPCIAPLREILAALELAEATGEGEGEAEA